MISFDVNADPARLRAALRAALALHGLALPPDALARVEEHFLRIAQIAQLVLDEPLDAHDEPAPRYLP